MLSLLLSVAAFAQEPAPATTPVETPAEVFDAADALRMAEQLAAGGAHDEARVLLEWVLESEPAEDVRAAAASALSRLPPEKSVTGAVVGLGAWQMIAGGWLLGPNNIWLAESANRVSPGAGLVFLGGLAGGAGGLGGTLWYARHEGLSTGKANNIFLGEALGAFHGAALTLYADDGGDWIPAGLLVGTLGGGAAGYYAASLNPDDGVAGATTSGAMWGAATALILLPSYDYFEGEATHDVMPIVLAADLGALAGNGLARALELQPDEVKLGNLFGVAGGLTMLGFAVATQNMLVLSPRAVGTSVEVAAIAGGAAGIFVARRMDAKLPDVAVGALIQGTADHVVLALPVPSVRPNKDGYAASVKLVDVRF